MKVMRRECAGRIVLDAAQQHVRFAGANPEGSRRVWETNYACSALVVISTLSPPEVDFQEFG